MPLRQPTPTTIRSFQFRENAYEFPVESVLSSQPGAGQLLIEPSAGYLVTTQDDTSPQSVLSLNYVRQADGSWAVRTMVTLLASGPALVNGSVTIQDPLGETVTLVVTIETALSIEGSFIQFNETKPGQKAFCILKVKQQGAYTPVVLSTDLPDQFALAVSRKELHYVPDLTITPSFDGTYVHIRYVPSESGRQVGHLYVKTPYESRTLPLVGHTSGVRQWFALRQSGGLRILALLVAGVLLGGGYTYRCQLIPGFCQPQSLTEAPIAPAYTRLETPIHVPTADTSRGQLVDTLTKRTELPKLVAESPEIEQLRNEDTARFIIKEVNRHPAKQADRAQVYRHKRPRQPKKTPLQNKPKENQAESDLERELNGKPNG